MSGAVLLAPVADAAPAWSLVSRLADGATPKLATNRSGLMVAAWTVGSAQIRTSFRAPGGSWQSPVTVATSHTGSTRPTSFVGNGPEVALDDSGTATLMWAETASGGPETDIYSVSGTASGWSSPELRQGAVAGPLEAYGYAEGPVTAVGRDGTVYAAWYLRGCAEYTPPNPRDNYCVRYVEERYFTSRSPGGAWTAPERLDADLRVADIAVGPDDTVVVAGTAAAPAALENRRYATAITRPRGGSWSAPKVLNTPGRSMAFTMQVHLAADDTDVTAAFGECDAAIVCHVAASRGPAFDDGAAISPEVDHHDLSRVNVGHDPVRLASSRDGEVTAVWNLDIGRSEHSEGLIQSSRRAPGSAAWDATRTLSSGLQYNQTSLGTVDVGNDGTAVADWNSSTWTQATGYTYAAQIALRATDGTWGAPAQLRPREDPTLIPRAGPISARAGNGYTVLATVGSAIGWSDRVEDNAPPTTRMTGPGASTATAPRFAVSWSATDAQSAITLTEVQRRAATWRGTFGPWSSWTTGSPDRSTATYPGSPARTYCFRARSTDAGGNVGAWSPEQCRTTPVDDRSTHRGSGWKRAKVSGSYLGTETTTTKHGKRLSLTGGHGRRYALLATTCRSCGSVRVSIGGKAVRTISLRSTRTLKRHVLPIATYPSVHTGTVVLTVHSHGKPVRVDGIVVAR